MFAPVMQSRSVASHHPRSKRRGTLLDVPRRYHVSIFESDESFALRKWVPALVLRPER